MLITKDSEAWDDIGIPALVKTSAKDIVSGYHLALLRPPGKSHDGRISPPRNTKPLYCVPTSPESKRCTRYGLTQESIKSLRVPVPPITEQTAIAEFLNQTSRRLHKKNMISLRQVELLREMRTRLIADVVTGKLDVREVAPCPGEHRKT